MKFRKSILAMTLGLALSGASHAGEWSVGGLVGQSSVDDLEKACFGSCVEVNDSDTSLGVNVAYNFDNAWGVELGYIDLGTVNVRSSIATPFSSFDINVEGDASAVYLAGTGTLNISDRWSLTGRAGIASLDLDAAAVGRSDSEKSEEAIIGASIDYSITDSFSAGLRFDKISDANSIALGVRYSFGK